MLFELFFSLSLFPIFFPITASFQRNETYVASPSITPVLLPPQTLPHWMLKGGLVDWVTWCQPARKLSIYGQRSEPRENARVSLLSLAALVWLVATPPNGILLHRHPKLTLHGWNVISIVASESLSRYKRSLRRCSWDIKYWGLRTINVVMFDLLIHKLNKEYSSLLYLCVSVLIHQ